MGGEAQLPERGIAIKAESRKHFESCVELLQGNARESGRSTCRRCVNTEASQSIWDSDGTWLRKADGSRIELVQTL